MQSYKNILVVSDFNVDLSQESIEACHLQNLISERSLKVILFGPTQYGLGRPTAIDHAIVDSMDNVTSFSTSSSPIAEPSVNRFRL